MSTSLSFESCLTLELVKSEIEPLISLAVVSIVSLYSDKISILSYKALFESSIFFAFTLLIELVFVCFSSTLEGDVVFFTE